MNYFLLLLNPDAAAFTAGGNDTDIIVDNASR
jgi:hypothetical protein